MQGIELSQDRAIRYMNDPGKDGKSLTKVSQMKKDTLVHHSSGIMNKAFYLIATSRSFSIWEAFDMFAIANWSVDILPPERRKRARPSTGTIMVLKG